MASILFLLCFGVLHCTVSSNRLRVLSVGTESHNYSSSVKNCTDYNQSLVTLYDRDDVTFINNKDTISTWVSLQMNRSMTWSDNTPYSYTQSNVTLRQLGQICEAIVNETWTGFNCSFKKFFMCKGKNYTLIEKKRNWCQALEYCRRHNMKLVSISNDEENDAVIREGKNRTFWIGLMHDKWKWEDNTCSVFREIQKRNFSCDESCVMYSLRQPHGLGCVRCNGSFTSMCSKGHVRIKYIRENRTWEDAFNFCKENYDGLLWIDDESDQFAVKQWLHFTNLSMPGEKIWIGLRQSRIFGFWIWTSDITVGYSNWKGGTQPQLPLSNHCGAINNNDNWTWSDENCLVKYPFLCEEKITDI